MGVQGGGSARTAREKLQLLHSLLDAAEGQVGAPEAAPAPPEVSSLRPGLEYAGSVGMRAALMAGMIQSLLSAAEVKADELARIAAQEAQASLMNPIVPLSRLPESVEDRRSTLFPRRPCRLTG